MNIAIVGIHTGIGKTLASAIICEAIGADYWKPVQAGSLEHTDTDEMKRLVSNTKTTFHKEAFRLTQPMSPHVAARIDKTEIVLSRMNLPVANHLLVETAGGLMSPLNDKQTNLDLVKHFKLPVIVVSQNYLGSINHTLLTYSVLKSEGVEVRGVLFNGDENITTQEYILSYSGFNSLGRINNLVEINKTTVEAEAKRLRSTLLKAFA